MQNTRYRTILQTIDYEPPTAAGHSSIIFLAALGIYVCTQVLSMTQYASLNPVFVENLFYANCAAMALCGIYFVIQGIDSAYASRKYLYGSAGIVAFSLIVCILTNVTWFIYPIIFVVTAVKVSHRRILRLVMVENLVVTSGVVIAAWFQWIPDSSIVRPSGGGLGRIRYTLGFVSPNHIGQLLASVLICYYCLYGIKHVLEYLLTVAIGAYTYLITNSRAAAIVILILLVISLFRKLVYPTFYIHRILPLTRYLIVAIPLVWLLLSMWYQPEGLLKTLNKLFSKRLYFSKMGLEKDGIWLFGHPLNLVSTTESVRTGRSPYVLDNSYMYTVIQFGILFFLLLLGIYYVLYTKFMNCGRYRFVEALFVVLVYATFENILLRININPLPLLLFASLDQMKIPLLSHNSRLRKTAC